MDSRPPIYLDNHSTTAVDPRVLEEMLPWFSSNPGNASSALHKHGQAALEAVEMARSRVAQALDCESSEIYFTSGATESINIALQGYIARLPQGLSPQIVTSQVEHPATLETCTYLEKQGHKVTRLPVEPSGQLDLEQLHRALRKPYRHLVSILAANNETGTLYPIREIADIVHEHGGILHVDAAQAVGKIPVSAREWNFDLLSISSHKFHGPKGIGALVVRRRRPGIRLHPLHFGGGQERGLRPGTLNVPGIVGLGAACHLIPANLETDAATMAAHRDLLLQLLQEEIPGLEVNGSMAARLPNNLNLSFPGVEGESLIVRLRNQVSLSSGSACSSARGTPSHVLKALGLPPKRIHSSLRFGLSRFTTREEIQLAAAAIVHAWKQLRELAPVESSHLTDDL